MSEIPVFHWLPTVCRPGSEQMALDEALLLATGEDGIGRFRFYYWPEPTISLGYFQDYGRFLSVFPKFAGFPIVRRLTGGGAILHDREITYCLTLPAAHELYKAGPMAAYIMVHEVIAEVLKRFGIDLELRPKDPSYARVRDEPEFCFARPCPTDLICPAGKLVGSAQRRLPKAFLQHGSIMLENRFAEQPTAAINGLTSDSPANNELEKMIVERIAQAMRHSLASRDFTKDELAATKRLIAKYAGREWTVCRMSG